MAGVMKYIALTIIASAIALTSVFAGSPVVSSKNVVADVAQDGFFRDSELQVDAFYSLLMKKPRHDANHYRVHTGSGGGLGLNYIFGRYFGVGVENALVANNRRAPYSLGGYGLLRFPIEQLRLAPYAIVGGGAALTAKSGSYGYGNVGGGLEYRFTPNIGTFADWRWMYGKPAKGSNLRAGLRYIF